MHGGWRAYRAVGGGVDSGGDIVTDAVLHNNYFSAHQLREAGCHRSEAELVLWATFRAALHTQVDVITCECGYHCLIALGGSTPEKRKGTVQLYSSSRFGLSL